MEKVKTEEVRRKLGRPKLDARITEEYAPSRRQALNKMWASPVIGSGYRNSKQRGLMARGQNSGHREIP